MNIPYISDFAKEKHPFGVTGPLTHDQVVNLARRWTPQIRFHENEKFHSLALGRFLRISRFETTFDPSDWLLAISASSEGYSLPHSPPLVYDSHDSLQVSSWIGAPSVDYDSYFTTLKEGGGLLNARDYDMSLRYYGSNTIDSSGTFQEPRHIPISIIAEFRKLIETLKENLLAHLDILDYDRPEGYPHQGGKLLDKVRNDFLFGENTDQNKQRENFRRLLELIEAHENGDGPREKILLEELSPEVITQNEWRAIVRYSFLEYYFFYVHSDFCQYNLFANCHEGDIEGCCMVFRNNELTNTEIKPKYLITSAHEPGQDVDKFRELIDLELEEPRDENDETRIRPTVWVALGSHATYLGPGVIDPIPHVAETVNTVLAILVTAAAVACASGNAAACLILAILLIIWAIFHWGRPKDRTSDNGVHADVSFETTISTTITDVDPHIRVLDVITTPLSNGNNIYYKTDPIQSGNSLSLAERAFPGKWGGDNAEAVHFVSPRFNGKTKRFFETFVQKSLDIWGYVP